MSDVVEGLPNPNPEGQELEPTSSVPIDPASLARHYEQDDVDVRGIVRFGIVIAVATVVAGTVLAVVLRWWTEGPLPVQIQVPPALVTPPPVPGPGLDAAPEVNLENYLLQENERLYGYGWVDREAGIVHIPIEEAMRRLVEQGVAAREAEAPVFGLDPSFELDASGGLVPAGGTLLDTSAGESGGATSGEDTGGADNTTGEAEGADVTEEGTGTEESGSEEPGGSEAGGDATGDSAGEGTAGEDAGGEGVPSSSDVGDDGDGPPGSIDPDDEDASGEEPGGAQSGN